MKKTCKISFNNSIPALQLKNQANFQQSSSMGSNFSCTPSDLPVYQYMLEWLETRKYVLQPSTYNSYGELINGRIKKYYSSAGLTVASLKPADIRAFYMGIFRDGCSPATVIHYHVILRKAFQQAFKEDIIPCNPFDKVDRPRADKYHAKFLHEEELAILLQNAKDDPMYIVLYLAAVFGLRRSEALGVRWSRIDFDQKRILFDTKVIEVKTNGRSQAVPIEKMKNDSSRRYLPLTPNAEAVLLDIQKKIQLYQMMFANSYSAEYDDYVCCDPLGQIFRPSYVSAHFKVILKQRGLPDVRFHDLRHTCASILIQHQIPLIAVKEYLGHSDISTTANIYVHLEEHSKRTAALLMDTICRPERQRVAVGGTEHE